MATYDPFDDAAQMALVQQRNQAAFAVLYARYSQTAFNVASYILRDRTLAEEVTQDVFVLLWRYPEKYQIERGALGSWIRSVTRYLAIDRLRSELRHNRAAYSLDEAIERMGTMPTGMDADEISHLKEIVNELPVEQRQVLFLAFFQDFTHEQISERLQVPPGTVKSRLRLALGKLRARWNADSGQVAARDRQMNANTTVNDEL